MFSSREIRWFFRHEKKPLTKWFSDRGLFFYSSRPRTDYYYALVDSTNVGLKLREGRIEYKHKLSQDSDKILHKNAIGRFQNWVKWSFNLEEGDSIQQLILGKKSPASWIKVYKERVGIKLYNGRNGKSLVIDIGEQIESGCQIEYTRIIVRGEQWYTFGLEYFGKVIVEPDEDFLNSLLEDLEETKLEEKEAMSYPKFFQENIFTDKTYSRDKIRNEMILRSDNKNT